HWSPPSPRRYRGLRGTNQSHAAGRLLHPIPIWRTAAPVLLRRGAQQWPRAQRDVCCARAVEQFRLPSRVTGFDERPQRRVWRRRRARCALKPPVAGHAGVLPGWRGVLVPFYQWTPRIR
uniref:Uncharacterized protein n=1 Tax=Aegilops tauschii subsp. strangulata TaxID=200361 RepID=A0A453S3W3_AEGTS